MTPRLVAAAILSVGFAAAAAAQDATMSFFITSENPGQGGDLGGLDGADAYCTSLAEAAGVTGKIWAAYLSASTENARNRIGDGPWYNAKGEKIADDVDTLHEDSNGLSKEASLNEQGEVVNGRGDTPNRHDIMTGSNLMGELEGDACADWTSGGEGSTMVGHHDRTGGGDNPTSWNSAHASRGCSIPDLQGTGGDGLFYCFATD